jgi:hypothetical protein
MKRILFLSLALIFGFLLTAAAWYYTKLKPGKSPNTVTAISNKEILTRLNGHAKPLLAYAKEHGYNTSICFLVDMSIESGKNRFFVYDLKKSGVVDAGLVAHGRCNKDWLSGRQYGNEVGCGCTSLGKYKIGYPYTGRFGRAYKLYGLDATNSNAFKRFVVLHSYTAVPNNEVDPLPICQSDGCPMVSAAFLQKLGKIIDQSPQPVLLYIYDKN